MSSGDNVFDDQTARGVFDPFACLGLHPDFPHLNTRLIRMHFRLVLKHVFQRENLRAMTTARNVPKWHHVNKAKDMLSTDAGLLAAISMWMFNSVQTWNPYAEPGSEDAKKPLATKAVPAEYMPAAFIPSDPPTGASSRPKRKSDFKDVFGSASSSQSAPNPDKKTASKGRAAKRKSTDGYSTAGSATGQTASSAKYGSYKTPIVVDESEEDEEHPAASSDIPQTPRKQQKRNVSNTASSSAATPFTPSTPSRRRREPLGAYVGRWNASGLPLHAANAVYAGVDAKGRINRRISKEDNSGTVVTGGSYDSKRTACSHDDIAYIDKYRGLAKATIDNMIRGVISMQSSSAALPASSEAPLQLTWYNMEEGKDGEDDEVPDKMEGDAV